MANHPRRAFLSALVLALSLGLALSGSAPALAQTPLPNQYTAEDGSLTFAYPKGWQVYKGSSSIDLAPTQEALDASSPDEQLPRGQILVQFALPNALRDVGVDPDSTTEEAAQAVLDAVEATGDILPYDGGPEGSVISAFEGGPWRDASLLIIMPFPDRLVLVAVRLGEAPGNYETLLRDIMNSVEVGESAQALATLDAEGLLHQWASSATGSSQYSETSWDFMQATGAPDTFECGDIATAWASASGTGQDSLALRFDAPVTPTQINIHQTFNPGSIVFVEIGSQATGESLALEGSADPPGNTECPGIFTIDVEDVSFAVDAVVIYLDQSIGGSWDEIDAVELVGAPAEELPEPVATAEATREASQ